MIWNARFKKIRFDLIQNEEKQNVFFTRSFVVIQLRQTQIPMCYFISIIPKFTSDCAE